jgi:hypothetical protein
MPEEPVARFMGGGAGDCKVTFHADDYIGEGASRGLSRGILVFTGGKNLTGEGMGIGSIAFRKGGCTYFPSTCLTRSSDNTITEKVFFVDTWRKWARKGRPSRYLTNPVCPVAAYSCLFSTPSP